MTEISGDNQDLPFGKLPIEPLRFKMQIAHVVAAHDGSASRIVVSPDYGIVDGRCRLSGVNS